jgi:hypothetical protein
MDRVYKEDIPRQRSALQELKKDFSDLPSSTDRPDRMHPSRKPR